MAKNREENQGHLASSSASRNYITVKNKTNDRERIEMKKYCPLGSRPHAPQGDP